MNLIEIDGKKIKLSSGITEEEFARTRFSNLLTDRGVIAHCTLAEGDELSAEPDIAFSDWAFDSIKSEADKNGSSIVFYEGTFEFMEDDDPAPVTLADIFESNSHECVKAAALISATIKAAVKKKIELPLNGGGILLSIGEHKARLIFLPQEVFFNSVPATDDKTFSRYIGFYRIPLLAYSTSILFMQAVLTYRAITGQFPYAKENPEERFADIMDKNFLPIEYAVEGIDKKSAEIINRAIVQRPSGGTKEWLDLQNNLYQALLTVTSKTKDYAPQNSEAFKKRAEEYLKSKNAKVETKRKLHKNSAKIIAGLATFSILLLFVFSTIRTNGNQPTTKGLTPAQVTECFFQSINDKDVQLMMEVCKGNKFKPYLTTITNMHVANAASQAYTFSSVNVAPHKWFFFAQDNIKEQKTSLFGISNLEINGKASLLDAKASLKKEKPLTVSGDDAGKQDGYITQDISYYIVETAPETGNIEVEYTSGTVTLSWMKNRWILTDINVEAEQLPFDSTEFKAEYWHVLKASDGDVVKAAEQLRFRYPWIPSRAVMENEEKALKELF